MKPFLLFQLRPEDEASDGEYEALLRFGGLKESEVQRMRVEHSGVPAGLTLENYAGIIVGGGPYNVSDPAEKKTSTQQKVEHSFAHLFDAVLERDMPFFGACYGIGILTAHCGGLVSKKYGEAVGAVDITCTSAGAADPIFDGVPHTFRSFVGHKEACEVMPAEAVLLASSPTCPVQMLRFKNNIYATQFHPELDIPGITTRIRVYKNHGYFPPNEAEALIARIANEDVSSSHALLHNFVERYRAAA